MALGWHQLAWEALPFFKIMYAPPIISTYSGAESADESGMRVAGLQSQ